jgi:(heptosyl)LPS beta-1,4-glucosyltransferase
VRLGGFVIHGNAKATLAASLESLKAVCAEVVAVDSGSTDGSAELVRAAQVRAVSHRWEGYGAARAAAVAALPDCDWLLYLDADEWLEAPARETLKAWAPPGDIAAQLLPVHDWAELSSGRFRYRTHHRARLVRRDAAIWAPRMIVHEALSQQNTRRLDAPIEHHFATDVAARGQKEETYALLWAVRAHAEQRRAKTPWLQRPALFLRDAFFKGAFFRGGLAALKLAWTVAGYHSRKYERLRELSAGQHAPLVSAYAAGDYARVFSLIET